MKTTQNPKRINAKRLIAAALVLVLAITTLAGCGGATATTTLKSGSTTAAATAATAKLSGRIIIDGSSTVFPISEAMAEEFGKLYKDVQIPIGFSGTGGGFKKFTIGEIDISNASRPIKDSEKELAKTGNIEYVELRIAYDGLSVVVNKANTWAKDITVAELKKIWAPNSTVVKWSDVRTAWPAEKINLYGPGTDSGTFEYFTEAINGKAGDTRKDYTPSEDDNVLVQGVSGDKYAMGYFGFAYYEENIDKLNVVAIDNGKGAITPTQATVMDGTYAPLSRPLFMYVNKKSLAKPEVKAFVEYFLTTGTKLIQSVGYVPLKATEYQTELAKIK
jgi:phosphate transport system substrate-binding protein